MAGSNAIPLPMVGFVGLTGIVVANQSPYVLTTHYQGQDHPIQPWTSDKLPLDPSGLLAAVLEIDAATPIVPSSGLVSSQVTVTIYTAPDLPPSSLPSPLAAPTTVQPQRTLGTTTANSPGAGGATAISTYGLDPGVQSIEVSYVYGGAAGIVEITIVGVQSGLTYLSQDITTLQLPLAYFLVDTARDTQLQITVAIAAGHAGTNASVTLDEIFTPGQIVDILDRPARKLGIVGTVDALGTPFVMGQQPMTGSVPTVIASDQSSIPTKHDVNQVPGMIFPFGAQSVIRWSNVVPVGVTNLVAATAGINLYVLGVLWVVITTAAIEVILEDTAGRYLMSINTTILNYGQWPTLGWKGVLGAGLQLRNIGGVGSGSIQLAIMYIATATIYT